MALRRNAFIFVFGLVSLTLFAVDKPLPKTSFLVFGDFGMVNSGQREVAKGMETFCARQTCDFAVLVGDNFYPVGVSSKNDPLWKTAFEEPYKNLAFPFYAVLGNHDHWGNIQAQFEYTRKQKRWNLPSAFYTFRKNDVEFFMTDTQTWNGSQEKWLTKALEASSAPWKIVVGHHPVYSYGEHGSTKSLKQTMLPIMEDEAQFYLAGHDHDLQFIESNGMGFLVSGAAAQARSVKAGPGTIFSASQLGFSHLSIEGDLAKLRILDKEGKTVFYQERKRQDSNRR